MLINKARTLNVDRVWRGFLYQESKALHKVWYFKIPLLADKVAPWPFLCIYWINPRPIKAFPSTFPTNQSRNANPISAADIFQTVHPYWSHAPATKEEQNQDFHKKIGRHNNTNWKRRGEECMNYAVPSHLYIWITLVCTNPFQRQDIYYCGIGY